jgi:ATP phosphoribosyltransferase regulatory subunit
VIDAARLPAKTQAAAWEALGRKDEAALAALASRGRGPAAAKGALPQLAAMYGENALARARTLARAVPEAAGALQEVEAALRLARARGVTRVAVDLGETRGLGYYTGITFAGYAPGAGSAVAQGGRYDELLARFGRPGPAIGFGVDLEFATQALERVSGERAGVRAARRPRGRGARPRR